MIEEVKLGTICELYSAGDKPKMFSDVKTDKCSIPVYGNGRDNEGLVGFTDKASFKCPAVTIAARGSSCGTAFYRGNPYTPIVRLISLVPKHNVDAKYLYYQIVNRHFRGFGSGQPQITIPDIVDAVIHLETDLEIQKRIANVLFTIDTKIANNNAICADLEGMAKLLYDYWFVQFDFPHKNGKPYKSSGGKMVWNEALKREIPEGWEVNTLPNVCDLQYGFPLSTNLFGTKGKGVIRIRDIINNSISAITSEIVDSEYYTEVGDLLVGMDGNFQMNYWTRAGEIVNQRITRIRKKNIPLMIIKMQIEPYIAAKVLNVARSTVGHLGDSDFKDQFILCPKKMDFSFFENALAKIIELRNENQQLASLRDFLLPMLMNGQVKVGKTDA